MTEIERLKGAARDLLALLEEPHPGSHTWLTELAQCRAALSNGEIAWAAEFTVPPDARDGTLGVAFENGGASAVMYHPVEDCPVEAVGDECFFVRLHSQDEEREAPDNHPLFRRLMGRRVRVTVETLGEERLPAMTREEIAAYRAAGPAPLPPDDEAG